MDNSFPISIPSAHPLSPLTTSLSLTTSPSPSCKTGQLHSKKMRRTVSASCLASPPVTSSSVSLAREKSSYTDPTLASAETSLTYQYTSVHAHWPARASIKRLDEPTERPDEDDYAWYFRNPHRYIRRPRPDAPRCRNNHSNILIATDSHRYSENGDGSGSEVNMRLFAAYLQRHYAATTPSTLNSAPEPTRAFAAVSQAPVETSRDGSRVGTCDRNNLQGNRGSGLAQEKTHSDDDASTIFSASMDDWDAPTLTNGSLRSSKVSCDMQYPSCDVSSEVVPCSPTALPGGSSAEVDAAFRSFPLSWDLGFPSKLIGTSYVEVGMADCSEGGGPGSWDSILRSQVGATDDIRSSCLHPSPNNNRRKELGISEAQRFSFFRIFSS